MKERVIGEVLLVRGIEKRSGVAAMRLLPNIPLGTERYPEKVARRLRTLNTSAPGSPPPPMVLCRRALFRTGTDLRPWNPHLFDDWVPGGISSE